MSKKKIIFFISLIILVVIITCLRLLFVIQQSHTITSVKNKSQQQTVIHHDSYLDQFALKDATASSIPLTSSEENFPTGMPQKFPGPQSDSSGTLVVTTDTPNVRIIVQTSNPADAQISGNNKYAAPANISPVRIILPVNYYTIIAEKDLYIWKWIPVVIIANKVTRLYIHLDPAHLNN